jgi:uncharacterized membrane protein YhhN
MTRTQQARRWRVPGGAFAALAITDAVLAAAPERWQRARFITKPLLMPTLATRTLSTSPRRGLLAAQAFSWGGDLSLMGRSRTSFLTGVGFFSGAHVSYISAFRSRSSTAVLDTPGRRRFLTVGGLLAVGMGLAAAREDRALAVPVAAYGVTLASMVAAAAAVDGDRTEVLSGAALFLASDALLGIRTFLVGEERRGSAALESVVMATYTAAQWRLGEGLGRR